MDLATRLVLSASVALMLLPGRSALAADDLTRVLRELDVAAANFHSTSADFEFDTYQTDPIPEKDVQKGTVYYERKSTAFQMAAHIQEVDGKPVPKTYSYAGGVLKLNEPMIDQVTTFKSASKFESYIMLGFGASGKELADKWDVKDLGPETLDNAKTEKLELIAKDPTVRQNLPKVTIWIDSARGVSLKQVFDQGQGQSRVCVYFNIKVNQTLPGDAFKLKTDSKTQFVDR
jgi:outer membrane lipoprotein-sorting protein